jgi:hypothetical protein
MGFDGYPGKHQTPCEEDSMYKKPCSTSLASLPHRHCEYQSLEYLQVLPLWQHVAPVHPFPPHWPYLGAQLAGFVGCVPELVVGVPVEAGAEVPGLPPPGLPTAALKKSHVSPGANLIPFVPDGSGTWPPPCAIQVTGAREQL